MEAVGFWPDQKKKMKNEDLYEGANLTPLALSATLNIFPTRLLA
jgi:hypothetical protein